MREKKSQRLLGCPSPLNVTLQQRLSQIIGITPVRVLLPGSEINGVIQEVDRSSFRVNGKRICFDSPFAIDQGFFEQESTTTNIIVKVKGIGTFKGQLVQIGRDFVEFEQELPEDIARWIIPLNQFVLVRCDEEPEE